MTGQEERRKRAADAIYKMFGENQLIDSGGNLDLYRLAKEVAKFGASEAAEARRQEREACAKAMCMSCANEEPLEGRKHVAFDPDGKKYLYNCRASSIHERVEGES